ncbi:MAG: hypothetical protein EAZ73_22565 [Oscillatoriales cyanobacterium]|nr:MAG: hypothetical protein EAZ83_21175 [Oscillatoriales cyanobacterium]TAF17083.1 MAG: hypothetical protein EAZ73_22565 [Oscillatoriales cyanobacterium]
MGKIAAAQNRLELPSQFHLPPAPSIINYRSTINQLSITNYLSAICDPPPKRVQPPDAMSVESLKF